MLWEGGKQLLQNPEAAHAGSVSAAWFQNTCFCSPDQVEHPVGTRLKAQDHQPLLQGIRMWLVLWWVPMTFIHLLSSLWLGRDSSLRCIYIYIHIGLWIQNFMGWHRNYKRGRNTQEGARLKHMGSGCRTARASADEIT